MNEIISHITPLTRGIIWMTNDHVSATSRHYKAINYVLDGLLASTVSSNSTSNQLLVGQNFGQTFYVYISNDLEPKSFASFTSLIAPQLNEESDVAVFDELGLFQDLLKKSPDILKKKFHLLK